MLLSCYWGKIDIYAIVKKSCKIWNISWAICNFWRDQQLFILALELLYSTKFGNTHFIQLEGTTERPRLCVFRSNKHIYVQVIDDSKMHTLASASTVQKPISEEFDYSSGPTIVSKFHISEIKVVALLYAFTAYLSCSKFQLMILEILCCSRVPLASKLLSLLIPSLSNLWIFLKFWCQWLAYENSTKRFYSHGQLNRKNVLGNHA